MTNYQTPRPSPKNIKYITQTYLDTFLKSVLYGPPCVHNGSGAHVVDSPFLSDQAGAFRASPIKAR